MEKKAFCLKNNYYLRIQEYDLGYEYAFYDPDYYEIDGGVIDDPDIPIDDAAAIALKTRDLTFKDIIDNIHPDELDALTNPTDDNYYEINPLDLEQMVLQEAKTIVSDRHLDITFLKGKVIPYTINQGFNVLLQYDNNDQLEWDESKMQQLLNTELLNVSGHLLTLLPIQETESGTLDQVLNREDLDTYIQKRIGSDRKANLEELLLRYVKEKNLFDYPDTVLKGLEDYALNCLNDLETYQNISTYLTIPDAIAEICSNMEHMETDNLTEILSDLDKCITPYLAPEQAQPLQDSAVGKDNRDILLNFIAEQQNDDDMDY